MYTHTSPKDRYKNGHSSTIHNSQSSIAGRIMCPLERRQEVFTFVCCCCCCQVASVVSNSVRPHRRQPTRLPVPGLLQARTLEWVAISSSNAWKWKVKVKSLSRVRLFMTSWTAAYQAPPSMGLSRQEYWSGVPLPSPCCIADWLNNNKKLSYCLVEEILENQSVKGRQVTQ